MGWLIALAVLTALAWLPFKVSVRYDAEGVAVRVLAGALTVWKMPSDKAKKPSEHKKKDKKSKAQKPKKEKKEKPKKEKKAGGGSLLDFLPLVQVGLDFLGDFRRKLRINELNLKLVLAGDDPCDLATNYGRIWAAVGNLFPALERAFVIKKRNIDIGCDFTAEETLVTAKATISITLGRVLALAVRYAIRALREFLKINKSRKGGAVQ